MKSRRYLLVGFALLAGCASQTPTRPTASSAHANKPAAQPAAPPPEEPKWEAATPPSASDLLARKAADYARSMQTTDGSTRPPLAPDSSTAQAGRSNKNPSDPAGASPLVDPSIRPEEPAATAQGTAVLTSARLAPPPTLPGDPQMNVPESADFQSTSVKSANADPLYQRLQKRLAQNPNDIAGQLDLELYGMLNDDPMTELASVSALPRDDRELVAALVDGLSDFRSTVRENGTLLAAQKIKPLLEMADRLRSQADLSIPTVELCSRVEAYGKYTPISPRHFPAGQPNAAIVYCEVENFLAKQNTERMWQTRLSEQVTLMTDQGMIVWSDPPREVTDECRNRRHDFFAYNVIHLPPTLPIGRYVLNVSIEDKNAGRIAEAKVPLSLTAQ